MSRRRSLAVLPAAALAVSMMASPAAAQDPEELVIGWVHGETTASVFKELLERTWLQHLARMLLMLLILVPLITVSEIYRMVGATRFREFLTRN